MDAIAHTQVSGFCLVTLAVLLRAQQKMRDKSLPGRQFTALLWFAGALTIVDYGSALAQLGAWEELGIPPEDIRLLGRADFLHLRSEALMHPVLGQVAPAALERLRLNPAEVRQTFLVSLDWLAAHPPEVYRYPLLPVGAEQFPYARAQAPPDYRWTPGQVEVPVYDGLPYPLRGLTARITRHVVQRATEGAE